MSSEKDTYYTIRKRSEAVLFKDRGSKFYGYAFPVSSEEEIKECIEMLKKEHHNARHWCYAWQLGMQYERYRTNDDGEPSNSAGAPIYGQILAKELTNILIVVVRYFGGTKLGVGGLVQAYKSAAALSIEASSIIKRTINYRFIIQCEYPELNKVQLLIKREKLNITKQEMVENCSIEISVRKKDAERISKMFEEMHLIQIKKR